MNRQITTFSVIQKAVLILAVSAVLLFTGHTVKADTATVTMNAETVTLTDANKEFELEAVSSANLASVEWYCSNRSVVSWDSNWNSGQTRWGVKLKALKNGTAIVRLQGSDGTVYASCQVICTDLTEVYGVQIAGIEITNRNCQSVTGEGISGTVIYHPDTNTLTLKNAVLSRGGDGDTFCVLLYRGRENQTLTLELFGNNVIRDVSWVPYSGDSYVIPSASSGGAAIAAPDGGSLLLKGDGSLMVKDSGIGTGVSCTGLRIAEGTSLELEIGGNRNSVGIDANTVTIDGTFLSKQTASVDVTGIDASKLVIGKSGDVQISVTNSNAVSSLSLLSTDAVHLPWGGSAEISGKLKASAFDKEEEVRSGRGIAGSREDLPSTVVVKESGQLEISTDLDAFQYIKLNLAKGLILNAGTDKKSAFTKDSVYGDNFVQIGKALTVIPDPKTVEKDTEDSSNNDPKTAEKDTEDSSNNEAKKVVKGKSYTVGDLKYKVSSADMTGKGTVTITGTTKAKNKLTKLTVPKTVKIGGAVFKVTAIGNKAFNKFTKIKTVTIGDNVKTIGTSAFAGNTKLTKVTIGKGVTKIGKSAFSGDKKLKTFTVKSAKLKSVGQNAIKGIYKKAAIKVPKKQLKKYKKLFSSKTGFKKTMKVIK